MPPSRSQRPSVKVRLATTADLPAIIPVVNAAFSVVPFLTGTRTDDARMAELMSKGEFLVAVPENSSDIIAAVYAEKRGGRGYVGMLAVESTWQGVGLGHKMMTAAEEHCRNWGCKHADISVLSLRPELLPYYRKLGYCETGTEEFRHSGRLKPGFQCHCIVMSKVL